MVENCGNCYYSKAILAGAVWLCRRYPPSIGGNHDNYPEVNSGKWCGEWKPKVKEIETDTTKEVDGQIVWAGKVCRARCGCCTRRIPSTNHCWENVRSPVFYNTPTFGCEKFEDNGEEIKDD